MVFLEFRDDCLKKVSPGDTNTNLRIVRSCLNAAQQPGLLGSNPASQVRFLKERGMSKRREMTIEEIQRVLRTCGDTPWRGLVLTGLYTGQRLGDCTRLTWQQVDLMNKTPFICYTQNGKTACDADGRAVDSPPERLARHRRSSGICLSPVCCNGRKCNSSAE